MTRPRYCPCENDTPDPCPACGASVNGSDPVRGVCQAREARPAPKSLVQLVLIDKQSGKIVASTR